MMVSIEQHVDWIADCVAYLRSHGLDCIEATQSAEDAWVEHGNEVANRTLYPLANSWYMGVNIPGKPQVFMPYIGGVGAYRDTCDDIAADGYRGLRIDCAGSRAGGGVTSSRLVVDEPVDLAVAEQPPSVLLHHIVGVAAG